MTLLEWAKILRDSCVSVDGLPYLRMPPHEAFLIADELEKAHAEIERLRKELHEARCRILKEENRILLEKVDNALRTADTSLLRPDVFYVQH